MSEKIIVYNEKSGKKGVAFQTAIELSNLLNIYMIPFSQALLYPSLIQGKFTIGIGGDGTQGSLELLKYRLKDDSPLLPAEGGTANFISRSLGWSRDLLENPKHYASRIGHSILNGSTSSLYIKPGIIFPNSYYTESSYPFLWSVSSGNPLVQLHTEIENSRSKLGRLRRMITGARAFMNSLTTASPFTIEMNENRLSVLEGVVVKKELKRFWNIELPGMSDVVCIIPADKNRAQLKAKFLIDVSMVAFGLLPLAGGAIIKEIKEGHGVAFIRESHMSEIQIDSELRHLHGSMRIEPSLTGSLYNFHLLKKV